MFGDMLHYLPAVDNKYNSLRQQFAESMTPRQREIDQTAYNRNQAEYGENRPYNEWFDKSRLDAYIRGGLVPEINPEWQNAFTPEQKNIIASIQQYLQTQGNNQSISLTQGQPLHLTAKNNNFLLDLINQDLEERKTWR